MYGLNVCIVRWVWLTGANKLWMWLTCANKLWVWLTCARHAGCGPGALRCALQSEGGAAVGIGRVDRIAVGARVCCGCSVCVACASILYCVARGGWTPTINS